MSSDNLTTWLAGVTPVGRSSAGDVVRAGLLQAIEAGTMDIGSKLPTEAELSRAYRVSRPVIREALESLRVLGLVETRPGRGTFVVAAKVKTPLSVGSCSTQDLYEVRRFLEVPAARLCAARRDDADVAELGRLIGEHQQVTAVRESANLDIDFHLAIAAGSRNPLLPQLIGELRAALADQTYAITAREGRLRRAIEEHTAILDAIRAGDPDGAAGAMEAHLSSVDREIGLLGH